MSEVEAEQALAPDPAVETVAEPVEERHVPEMQHRERRAQMLRGTIEHREVALNGMECRALDDGTLRMSGIASATEHFYDVGDPESGGFRERILRNVFRSALAEKPDVSLLGNHEGWPLASTKNESLTLQETPAGLRWDADLDPEDPDSRVIARKVAKGLLTECSFAFLCRSDQWNDDYTERTVTGLSLNRGDVSIVTHGANPATSVSMLRSIKDGLEERSGKILSATNYAEVEAIRDAAQKLLDGAATRPEPEPEAEPGLVEQGREALQEAQAPRSRPPLVDRRSQQRLDLLRAGGRR